MSKIKAIIAASLCTFGVLAAPSMAMAHSTIQTHVPVFYQDLDLTTNAGQKSLQRRINAAARKACGRPSHSKDLANLACYQNALGTARTQFASAIQDANTPRLGG